MVSKDAEKVKLKLAEQDVQKSNFSLASSNLVTLDISGLQDMVAEIAEKVDVIHSFGQSSRDLITALQKEKEDMKDKLSAVQASLLAIKPLTSRIDKLTAEFSEYKIVTDEKMRKVAVSFAEMERHSVVPKVEVADAAPGPAGKGEKGGRKTVVGSPSEWTDLLENVKLSTAAIREIRTEHVTFGRQIETLQMQVRQLYELGAKKDDLQEVQDLVWKQGEKLTVFDTNYEAMLKSLEMIRLDTAGLTFSTTKTFEKHEQQISSLLTTTDNISQDHNEKHTELRKITGIIKEEVWKTSHDVKVMEDAANGALGLQYGYMDAIKERLEELSVKAEVDLMDNLSMKNRVASYEEAVQVSHADNNTFTKLNRLGKAVAELSSATAVVVGVASARLDAKHTAAEPGGTGGSGVDEYELLNMRDELKSTLAPLQESVSTLEKKADGYDGIAVAHTAQLEEIEKMIGHINVRNDNMQGEIMARSEIEKLLADQRDSSVREFQVAMRRVDQLADGQQELEGKMLNKDDVLSTQYLEKCLGELSNDFASSMQRDHSEVMRLLDEKAPMDTIGGIERKFSQRLMQMEAILMKGVKGLDERASLALLKKADVLQLERLKDKLELYIASQASGQYNNAAQGAAAQIGEHCLTCASQVSSPPHGSPAKAVQMRNSKGFERGELPNMMPTGTWHNTFGGLNNENRVGASNNSRVATRRQETINRFGGSPRSAGRNSSRSSGGARPTSSGVHGSPPRDSGQMEIISKPLASHQDEHKGSRPNTSEGFRSPRNNLKSPSPRAFRASNDRYRSVEE